MAIHRRAAELLGEASLQKAVSEATRVMAREYLPVQLTCRVLHVAEFGCYAWQDRPPSNRLVKQPG